MPKLKADDLRRIADLCKSFQEELEALNLGCLSVGIVTGEAPHVHFVALEPEEMPDDVDVKVYQNDRSCVVRDVELYGCLFRQISLTQLPCHEE